MSDKEEKPRRFVIISWAFTALTSLAGGGTGTYAVIQPLFAKETPLSPPPPYPSDRPPPPLPFPPPPGNGIGFYHPIVLEDNTMHYKIQFRNQFFRIGFTPDPNVYCPNISITTRNRPHIYFKNIKTYPVILQICHDLERNLYTLYGLYKNSLTCNMDNNLVNNMCCKRQIPEYVYGIVNLRCQNDSLRNYESINYIISPDETLVISVDHYDVDSFRGEWTSESLITLQQQQYIHFPPPPSPTYPSPCPPTNYNDISRIFYPSPNFDVLNGTDCYISDSVRDSDQFGEMFSSTVNRSDFEQCFILCAQKETCAALTIDNNQCYTWFQSATNQSREPNVKKCFIKNITQPICNI